MQWGSVGRFFRGRRLASTIVLAAVVLGRGVRPPLAKLVAPCSVVDVDARIAAAAAGGNLSSRIDALGCALSTPQTLCAGASLDSLARAAAARGSRDELQRVLEMVLGFMNTWRPFSINSKNYIVNALVALAKSGGASEELLRTITRECQVVMSGLHGFEERTPFALEGVLCAVAGNPAMTPGLVREIVAISVSEPVLRRYKLGPMRHLAALAANTQVDADSLSVVVSGAEAHMQSAEELDQFMFSPLRLALENPSARLGTLRTVLAACERIWPMVRSGGHAERRAFLIVLASAARSPAIDVAGLDWLAEFASPLSDGIVVFSSIAQSSSVTQALLSKALHSANVSSFRGSGSACRDARRNFFKEIAGGSAASPEVLRETMALVRSIVADPGRIGKAVSSREATWWLLGFAKNTALDVDLLEQVLQAVGDLSHDADQLKLQVLQALVQHPATRFEVLRRVVGAIERVGERRQHMGARDGLFAASLAFSSPRFAGYGEARAAAAARALLASAPIFGWGVERRLGDACPQVLLAVGGAATPMVEVARYLQRAGLAEDVIADVRRLSTDPSASAACQRLTQVCADVLAPQADRSARIARGLWLAVCAADPLVRLGAAEGFLRRTQGRVDGAAISDDDLRAVGRCLRPRPGDEPGYHLAELLLAVLDGIEGRLRSSMDDDEGRRAICATLGARVEDVAGLPGFDIYSFRRHLAAACGEVVAA